MATVEFAFLMPLLTLLVFGILEFGVLAKNSQSLNHVAREAARVASTGATISHIHGHIADTAPGLDLSHLTSTIQYRMWDEDTGTWGEWTTLTDDGANNIATTGDQIRLDLQYSYELAVGSMFAGMLHASDDNMVSLDATMIAMRE